MDPSLAAEKLDWRAQIPLEKGIPETYHALIAEFAGEGRA
jgi:nucleoside-diphosphate-sugar epimerase